MLGRARKSRSKGDRQSVQHRQVLLFFKRRRLLAASIVVMLTLVYLAMLLGWLPSASSILHYNLFESMS
jgi:hypothetical protein